MTTFDISPSDFKHWNLIIGDEIATLELSVDNDGGLLGDYELKLNSYDLGVDIELANAIRVLRFTHPQVKCVVITSSLAGTFCAGANIRMLAEADHSHKVNFCKFTNETRLEIEEASRLSGIKFLAAINGACSGGGYELALACDHILLIDDKSTAISLPEVPLLGVLPGTGGLTRLTDKRHVRRDRADIFATKAEGLSGQEALSWGLVDELATPTDFKAAVDNRARNLVALSTRSNHIAKKLIPLEVEQNDNSIQYEWVSAKIDGATAELTIQVTHSREWLLQAARELDDILCRLRFDFPEIGTVAIRTEGLVEDAVALDSLFHSPELEARDETLLLWKRCLARLDLTAKTLIAVIEPGSCFVGVLLELAFAADRTFMLAGQFEDDEVPLLPATIRLTASNFGPMEMWNGITRIQSRLWGDDKALAALLPWKDVDCAASDAFDLGLVTTTPDDLDWDDELRLFFEERSSFSGDALTAMEANHRFCGPETMATKIFSRLSAWQNWIFTRPNATGPKGALRSYGTGSRPEFDNRRT